MISIVCWQWEGHDPRRKFDLSEVNRLQRGFKRFLALPHRFICICDDPTGLSQDVEWLRTPVAAKQWSELKSVEGVRFPACFRRLWVFSQEAKILGERVFTTDIDAVPVAQLDPLMEYEEDFVGWWPARDWGNRTKGVRYTRFGGGNFLLRTGTRAHVWDEFQGGKSAQIARKYGYRGSDQAWISYMLAGKEKYWPKDCGIYSVRDLGPGLALPKDARLVHFNGARKPWEYVGRGHGAGSWVGQYWQ